MFAEILTKSPAIFVVRFLLELIFVTIGTGNFISAEVTLHHGNLVSLFVKLILLFVKLDISNIRFCSFVSFAIIEVFSKKSVAKNCKTIIVIICVYEEWTINYLFLWNSTRFGATIMWWIFNEKTFIQFSVLKTRKPHSKLVILSKWCNILKFNAHKI